MATLIWQGTAALPPADGRRFTVAELEEAVGGPLRVVRLADRRGVCLVSAEGRRKGRGNMAASTLMDQDLFGPCVLFDSAEFGELPEGLDRRFPVERPVYAPVLSETEPTAPVDTSLVGREREVADAWYCLALLQAKGGGVGRRVGIAIRNIVGAAGNRHNAGDVVLFCDWEPSEMELGMAEGTCWVRPEGWDRILVDTPLPPEAIEERIKRRRRLYTHNMVYGVSGSSVIEVGAVRSAESAVSASRSAEAIPNSVSEGRRAARVAQGCKSLNK